MNQHALDPYADAVDVLSHFDLASHVMLALAQHDADATSRVGPSNKNVTGREDVLQFLVERGAGPV